MKNSVRITLKVKTFQIIPSNGAAYGDAFFKVTQEKTNKQTKLK